MSKFVEIRDWELQALCKCGTLASKKIVFVKSNTSHIFHGPEVVFRDKHLVVLSEGICDSKEIFIKYHAALSDGKHFFVVDGVNESLASVNSHWRHIRSVSFEIGEGTSNYCKKVGGEPIWFPENEAFWFLYFERLVWKEFAHRDRGLSQTLFPLSICVFVLVWNHAPVVFHAGTKLPGCF